MIPVNSVSSCFCLLFSSFTASLNPFKSEILILVGTVARHCRNSEPSHVLLTSDSPKPYSALYSPPIYASSPCVTVLLDLLGQLSSPLNPTFSSTSRIRTRHTSEPAIRPAATTGFVTSPPRSPFSVQIHQSLCSSKTAATLGLAPPRSAPSSTHQIRLCSCGEHQKSSPPSSELQTRRTRPAPPSAPTGSLLQPCHQLIYVCLSPVSLSISFSHGLERRQGQKDINFAKGPLAKIIIYLFFFHKGLPTVCYLVPPLIIKILPLSPLPLPYTAMTLPAAALSLHSFSSKACNLILAIASSITSFEDLGW